MDDGLGSKMVGLGMAWALSGPELRGNCVGTVLELCWNCVGKNKLPLLLGVWLFFVREVLVREVLVQRGHR